MVNSRWWARKHSFSGGEFLVLSMGCEWAANFRVSMCIVIWVLGSRGGRFGLSSMCSKSLTIPPCFN